MAAWQKTLEKMRQNPHDWRVDSLEAVARALGFEVRNPRGSHMVFLHHELKAITTVPARRPIKPVYIRHFLSQAEIVVQRQDAPGQWSQADALEI